jgi:hypothetical protein
MTPNFVSPAVNRLVAGANPARRAKINQSFRWKIRGSKEAQKANLATWLATICKTRGFWASSEPAAARVGGAAPRSHGATVRGLVRSAVAIVAFARLGSANLHHRFGIRDFEHPYYENVTRVGEVKGRSSRWPA